MALELRAELEGDHVSALSPLLRTSLPDVGPYRFSASLEATEEALAVSGLKGKFGSTDLGGELLWTRTEDRPLLTGNLTSRSLRVQDLATASDPAARKQADALNRPLMLDWLSGVDTELALEIRRVVGSPVPIRNATATAKVTDGRLTLAPTRLTLAGTPVEGGLTLGLVQGRAQIGLTAQTRRLDVGQTLKQLEAGKNISGNLEDLKLAVNSRGSSLRALLERADFSLKTRKGLIRSGDARAAEPWSIHIKAAEMKAREAQPISVNLDGRYREEPLVLTAQILTLKALSKGTRPWPLELSLQALGARIKAEGHVTDPLMSSMSKIPWCPRGEWYGYRPKIANNCRICQFLAIFAKFCY